MANKFGKKFSLDASPIVQATDDILANTEVSTPAPPAVQQPVVQQSDPIPYNEVLKNVGAKIPYQIYERLERIKRRSERSGIRSDKRNIGDLIAQAIKEFVEREDI